MKVALISAHSFLKPGGVKTHILGLNREYQKRNIETKIIVPRRKQNEKYEEKNIILLGTSFPIEFGGGISDLNISFNPFSIETILRKGKFDILHFHNFSFPGTAQILFSPYSFKTLNILTFHSNLKGSQFLTSFPIFISFLNKILKLRIDGIIGVSKLTLDFFKEYKKPKIVIPNGIDLLKFNPKISPAISFGDKKITILFVGRIEKRKGLLYLLKAFSILEKKFPQKLRLLVIGDGPEKEKCLLFIKKRKLKDILFLGEKKENLAGFYNCADIFCAPSTFGESFGIVLLEAMACQKPVVAFANEGYEEVFGDKKGVILVKNKNYLELAKALERLIKSESLRKKIGKIALREAKEYSFEKIAQRVLDFYDFCLKEKAKKFF
jgi:phosphatidylinositol alpha-mannosyltransferase